MAKEAGAPWLARAVFGGAFLAAALVVFHPLGDGLVLGSLGWPAAAPGGRSPRDLYDVAAVLHPFLGHASEALRGGRVPLWNPYAGAGSPFLANQQSAVLHPFTWLAVAVPWRAGLTVLALLRFGLAFGGTWLLARDLGQPRGAAAIAAASYATGGGIVVWILYPVGSVLAHVPLLLAVAGRVARGRLWVGWLGAGLASTVLAGHSEYLPVIWAGTLAVGLRRREALPPFLRAAAAAAMASAVLLLPVIEYLAQSPNLTARSRRQLTLEGAGPLLCAMVDPGPFCRGPSSALEARGYVPQTVAGPYVGALVLVLAGVGTAARPRLAAVACGTFLLLLPRPLGGLLWSLPVLSWMQPDKLWTLVGLALSLVAGEGARAIGAGSARILPATGGLAATLLLLQFETDLYGDTVVAGRGGVLAAALAGVAVAAAARAKRARAAAVPVALAGLLLERGAGIGDFNPWHPAAALYPPDPLLERLRERQGHDRIVGVGSILVPNLATVHHLRDTRIYDAISLEVHRRELPGQLWEPFGRRIHAPTALDRRAGATVSLRPSSGAAVGRLRESAVTGVTRELGPPGQEVRQRFPALPGELTSLRLHVVADPEGHDGLVVELRSRGRTPALLWRAELRPRWLPRSGWKEIAVDPPVATSPGEMLELVVAPAGRTVPSGLRLSTTPLRDGPSLVQGGATVVRLAFGASWNEVPAGDLVDAAAGCEAVRERQALPRARLRSLPAEAGRVRFLSDDAGEVVLAVEAHGRDVLELGDTFYPGWHADVDGKEVAISEDRAFRALEVPAGAHVVRMRYVPRSYRHGLFVSAMTLLAVAASLVGTAPRRDGPRGV